MHTDFTIEYSQPEDILELDDPIIPPSKAHSSNTSFPSPLYQLKLEYSKESIYATHKTLVLTKGDYIITPTRYGIDCALVMGRVSNPIGAEPQDVVTIIRTATEEDTKRMQENIKKEETAAQLFKEKAAIHNLDMKLITCHYLLEEPKILFFFSAENRIDFRKLVKDLVAILRIRIELRQIGVRDEAKFTGGLGCCGRALCCHSVTDRQSPVSIKMAKEQNLSLNSVKISGQCGRLLCCLSYEHDWYIEAKKNLPHTGTSISYDHTLFRITDINYITGMTTLSGDDGRVLSILSSRFYSKNGKWRIRD